MSFASSFFFVGRCASPAFGWARRACPATEAGIWSFPPPTAAWGPRAANAVAGRRTVHRVGMTGGVGGGGCGGAAGAWARCREGTGLLPGSTGKSSPSFRDQRNGSLTLSLTAAAWGDAIWRRGGQPVSSAGQRVGSASGGPARSGGGVRGLCIWPNSFFYIFIFVTIFEK
jgi:hypothetical protein